jgi:hypothetical protein
VQPNARKRAGSVPGTGMGSIYGTLKKMIKLHIAGPADVATLHPATGNGHRVGEGPVFTAGRLVDRRRATEFAEPDYKRLVQQSALGEIL